MSSTASAFVHVHATRNRSQKVPRTKSDTFWFSWMDSHDSSTILVLLYNIRLERSFSIERFQSYTLLNIVQNLYFQRRIYVQTKNTDLSR